MALESLQRTQHTGLGLEAAAQRWGGQKPGDGRIWKSKCAVQSLHGFLSLYHVKNVKIHDT